MFNYGTYVGLCKFVHLNRHVPIVFSVKQQITAFGCVIVILHTDGWLIIASNCSVIGCLTKNTIGT